MSRLNAAASRPSHCTVCSRALSFHQQWAGNICDDWRCRWTRLDREMEAHRREAARVLGVKQPEAFRAVVVPHRPGTIENLPPERRAIHLEYLNKLVMKATSCAKEPCSRTGEPVTGQPPVALAAAICAVCGGACCHRGGDRAFLDTAAMERVMAASPQTAPSKIVRTYAAHLPALFFAGSCVYHTVEGCALPRRLRADICNAYRCSGLKQAEGWACTEGMTRAYVVVREDNRIKRSAFVQPGDIRHFRYGCQVVPAGQDSKKNIEHRTSNIEF